MRVEKLGLLSIFLASLCCVVPVGLAVLGLGGLGLGAFIGANHWYFIAGAAILLSLAWKNYTRERKRCTTEQCEMAGGKVARITLPLATIVVVGFTSLNVYTYADSKIQTTGLVAEAHAQVVIPVEGMTCYSCTAHVEHSLQEIDGVQETKASVPDKSVTVNFDPQRVNVEKLVEEINRTGYRAKLPDGKSI